MEYCGATMFFSLLCLCHFQCMWVQMRTLNNHEVRGRNEARSTESKATKQRIMAGEVENDKREVSARLQLCSDVFQLDRSMFSFHLVRICWLRMLDLFGYL